MSQGEGERPTSDEGEQNLDTREPNRSTGGENLGTHDSHHSDTRNVNFDTSEDQHIDTNAIDIDLYTSDQHSGSQRESLVDDPDVADVRKNNDTDHLRDYSQSQTAELSKRDSAEEHAETHEHGDIALNRTRNRSSRPKLFDEPRKGSQSPPADSGFCIKIGGKKYIYFENSDAARPLSPSHQDEGPLHIARDGSHRSSSFDQVPLKDFNQIRTVSSPERVQYLPNGRPVPNLRTALSLAHPDVFMNNDSTTKFPAGGMPGLMEPSTLDPHNMKNSSVAADCCQVFSVFFALLVRVVMGTFCLLTVMLAVEKRDDDRLWGLAAILVLLLIESIQIVVYRKGQERKWISLCFVCYLVACLPSVWIIEMQRLGLFEDKLAEVNESSYSVSAAGLSTNIELSSDDVIFIMENCLVFLLILCRWLLPRGEITRDQLSQLLFVFIGMASDVMELFELFELEEVKRRRNLSIIILAVWSLSLFQFTLVLTMSANPKKARVAVDTGENNGGPLASGKTPGQRRTFSDFLLRSEIWSLMVTIMMQDGPFLAVRLYIVIVLNITKSNIIFFVCKNTIVLLLLLYRLIVVGLQLSEDKKDLEASGESGLLHDDFRGSNGNRKAWNNQKVPTISGRSAVTDMTTLSSVSTNKSRGNRKKNGVTAVKPAN